MKRKFIAVLVAVSLMTTSLALNPMMKAYAEGNSTSVTSLQNVGDELYGFKVIKTSYDESTQSNQILLKHVKSGAKMLVVKNSNLNRGFSVGFNTPTENDKGINHIIEHSILAGSEKYPTNSTCFNIDNNTYSTFANGFTGQNITSFPVCSQNEKQLMKLADVYMDAVYHPLVLKDKKVFEREAWRYELQDEASPLTVNGIVYNEMRANFGDIDGVESEASKEAVFPDSNQRYCSGGVPNSILDLSYEEFLNTYKKNYVPSNSFMVLYGDVDYAEFLKMLDENYLSKYDKKEVNLDRKEQADFSGLIEKDYDFPVAKDFDTTNKSKIDITFALPDIKNTPKEDIGGMILLRALLGEESLNFNKDLKNSGIAESYSVGYSMSDTYQPTFTISANNADPSRKMEFYNLIKDELKKLVSGGIDKEYAKAAVSSAKFNDLAEREEGTPGIIVNISAMYSLFDDPTVKLSDSFKSLEGKLNENYLEGLLDKYLIQNKQTALVTINPKAGLLEENDAKLKEKLQKKKDSMSQEEKDELIKHTKEFKEWTEQKVDQKVLDSLKAVTSKDIPTEVKDYNIKEQTIGSSVKLLTADANVKEAGTIGLYFDESHLSKDELQYLEFYRDMINENLPTKNYNEKSLINSKFSKANSFYANISVLSDDKYGETGHPVFGLKYTAMNSDFKDSLNLSKDVLLNTNLDGDLSSYIQRTITDIKQNYDSLFSNPGSLCRVRAISYDNTNARYSSFINGLDYYNFIKTLENDYKSNPENVLNKIKAARDKAFNKSNLTVAFAGNNDSQNKFKSVLGELTDSLSDKTYEKATYDLPVPSKREALTTNTEVQYVAFNSNLNNVNLKENGELEVLTKLLSEKVLVPELRLKGGAYGTGASLGGNSYYATTSRDKDLANSLKVISNSQDYASEVLPSLDESSLDNYIISTYASNNYPMGELTGAFSSLRSYINKTTIEDKKKLLEEIKNTNLDGIKSSPEILKKLNENANYVVVCSPEYAEQHKDLFDEIIPLK